MTQNSSYFIGGHVRSTPLKALRRVWRAIVMRASVLGEGATGEGGGMRGGPGVGRGGVISVNGLRPGRPLRGINVSETGPNGYGFDDVVAECAAMSGTTTGVIRRFSSGP